MNHEILQNGTASNFHPNIFMQRQCGEHKNKSFDSRIPMKFQVKAENDLLVLPAVSKISENNSKLVESNIMNYH